MADNNSYKQTPRRRGPGGGMAPAEKAKNFKGSISKLMQYIGRYKIAILAVMIMAAASTVFTVIGPKVLGKATTGLSEGLMKKKITGLILHFFARAVVGMMLIFIINQWVLPADSSINVGLNPVSFLTSGTLGIPGVCLLYGITFYQIL